MDFKEVLQKNFEAHKTRWQAFQTEDSENKKRTTVPKKEECLIFLENLLNEYREIGRYVDIRDFFLTGGGNLNCQVLVLCKAPSSFDIQYNQCLHGIIGQYFASKFHESGINRVYYSYFFPFYIPTDPETGKKILELDVYEKAVFSHFTYLKIMILQPKYVLCLGKELYSLALTSFSRVGQYVKGEMLPLVQEALKEPKQLTKKDDIFILPCVHPYVLLQKESETIENDTESWRLIFSYLKRNFNRHLIHLDGFNEMMKTTTEEEKKIKDKQKRKIEHKETLEDKIEQKEDEIRKKALLLRHRDKAKDIQHMVHRKVMITIKKETTNEKKEKEVVAKQVIVKQSTMSAFLKK